MFVKLPQSHTRNYHKQKCGLEQHTLKWQKDQKKKKKKVELKKRLSGQPVIFTQPSLSEILKIKNVFKISEALLD